jgi:hypothetical protein
MLIMRPPISPSMPTRKISSIWYLSLVTFGSSQHDEFPAISTGSPLYIRRIILGRFYFMGYLALVGSLSYPHIVMQILLGIKTP